MKKIYLLIPLLFLSSCGTYEYKFVYNSYKVQYRTFSSDEEKRYDVIEKNIDNTLGEKIIDIHKDLINYKGKKENQNDYFGNEFCTNYICILEGEISNYVIFGDYKMIKWNILMSFIISLKIKFFIWLILFYKIIIYQKIYYKTLI